MVKSLVLLPVIMLTACASNVKDVGLEKSDFELYDAAVKIEIQSGNTTISGSGTWIDDTHVLTASHLWLGVDKGFTLKVINKKGSHIAKILNVDNPNYRDLAVLAVEKNSTVKPPLNWQLPICDRSHVAAEPVWVLSGMYNILSDTYLSPDSTYSNKGEVGSDGLTGFFKKGVSGSSVLNYRKSCVYGVVSQEDIQEIDVRKIYKTKITTSGTIRKFLNESGLKTYSS